MTQTQNAPGSRERFDSLLEKMKSNEMMSIPELRELAVGINGSRAAVEVRVRALTSLYVALCDNLVRGLAKAIQRLTITTQRMGMQLGELMSLIGPIGEESGEGAADVGAAQEATVDDAGSEGPVDLAAQAAAELAALPASMRPPAAATTPLAPVAPAAPRGPRKARAAAPAEPAAPAPTDPAAIAAQMAGANNVPRAP